LLNHRRGPCPALIWDKAENRYCCGMVAAPSSHLRWLPFRFEAFMGRRFKRWIAAGSGCDFDAAAENS
jgi:hypothetical protein